MKCSKCNYDKNAAFEVLNTRGETIEYLCENHLAASFRTNVIPYTTDGEIRIVVPCPHGRGQWHNREFLKSLRATALK